MFAGVRGRDINGDVALDDIRVTAGSCEEDGEGGRSTHTISITILSVYVSLKNLIMI